MGKASTEIYDSCSLDRIRWKLNDLRLSLITEVFQHQIICPVFIRCKHGHKAKNNLVSIHVLLECLFGLSCAHTCWKYYGDWELSNFVNHMDVLYKPITFVAIWLGEFAATFPLEMKFQLLIYCWLLWWYQGWSSAHLLISGSGFATTTETSGCSTGMFN